jgi:hypothetical protein
LRYTHAETQERSISQHMLWQDIQILTLLILSIVTFSLNSCL